MKEVEVWLVWSHLPHQRPELRAVCTTEASADKGRINCIEEGKRFNARVYAYTEKVTCDHLSGSDDLNALAVMARKTRKQ